MSDAPSSAPAPSSGPASANDAQLTGKFAEESRAGYQPMRPSATGLPAPRKSEERTFESGRDAGEELARKRRSEHKAATETREVRYHDDHGRAAPKNETVDLDRAATDLQNSRFTDNVEAELQDRDQLARKVDKLRRDNGVPTQIDELNIDPNKVDPRIFGELAQQQPQIDPQHLQQQPTPAPPGIDPDLHLAFQNPKVRSAVEKEVNTAVTTAKTAQKHYAENVQAAQEIALGSINAAFPEMAGVKTQAQMQQLLNQLQVTNPQRWQQAKVMLQNFARLHIERQNMERQKQQFERQSFERESAAQDAAFNKSLASVPPQQRAAVAQEAISYAASLGIDERTLTHLMNTNPIMRHSAFRKMMFDAAAGSLARKQLAAQRQQHRAQVPPVSRPGHSNGGGGVRAVQNANLASLSAKLDRTGDARAAADLLIAQRNARRRG